MKIAAQIVKCILGNMAQPTLEIRQGFLFLRGGLKPRHPVGLAALLMWFAIALPTTALGPAIMLYDGTTNHLFARALSGGTQTNLDFPLYDGSMLCHVSSNPDGQATFEYSSNLALSLYDTLSMVVRLNGWGTAPAPRPMIGLYYSDNDGLHGTLWLDLTPFAQGDLADGNWHSVVIPLSAFQNGINGWKGFLRKIVFGRTAGDDRPPSGSGFPDPTGPAYELWFDNVVLGPPVGPVAATGHVVVDSNLIGLVFPDRVDVAQFTNTAVAIEVDNGSGFAPVPVVRRGLWSFPTLHKDGYTPARHTLYFQLASNLVEGARYRISHFEGEYAFSFYATNEICPGIKVNQVGYAPTAGRRYAYLGYFAGDGFWLGDGTTTGTVDYTDNGSVEVRRAGDHGFVTNLVPVLRGDDYNEFCGERVMDVDLSRVPAGQEYYLLLPGVGRSCDFGITTNRAFESFYVFARGLYHQRWNCALVPGTTSWPQPAGHTNVFLAEGEPNKFFNSNTPTNHGSRAIRGGHHDAGDFDLRPGHAQIASVLMTLCEYWPQKFADGQLDIPESGNSRPDLLDEALYQLQAWRDLQEEDGGVRAGVESYAHPSPGIFPHEDSLPYWTYRRDASVSAYVAGLFAQAARLLEPYDEASAADYLQRAERAYAYAVSNSAYSGWLMMAESHLLKSTQDPAYAMPLEQRLAHIKTPDTNDATYVNFAGKWPYNGLIGFNYQVTNGFETLPLLAYVTSPTNLAATGLVATVRTTLIGWGQQAVDFALTAGGKSPTSTQFRAYRSCARSDLIESWGGATTPGRVVNVLGAYALNSSTNFLDAISLSADLTLGCNPMGRVWATGLGHNNTRQQLDAESLAWVERFGYEQVPGLPTYGPTTPSQVDYQIEVYDGHVPPFFSLPLERRYCDAWPLVQCSEFTVWESCLPAIATTALLLPDSPMMPSSALHEYHATRIPPPDISNTKWTPTPFRAVLRWWDWQERHPEFQSNLVARWEFDEGLGWAALDQSTNHLTLPFPESDIWAPASPTWMEHPQGSALQLRGSSNQWGEVVTPALNLGQGLTLGMWLRPDNLSSNATVFDLRTTGGGAVLSVYKDAGGSRSGGRLWVNFNDDWIPLGEMDTGKWVHVFAVYDPDGGANGEPAAGTSGEVRTYINQIQDPQPYAFGLDNQTLVGSPLEVSGNLPNASCRARVGAGADNKGFVGALDQVVLYNDVLDRYDYAQGTVAYPGYQQGAIFVRAVAESNAWDSSLAATLDGASRYLLKPITYGNSYWFRAWLDANGNGVPDASEATGLYSSDSVNFTNTGPVANAAGAFTNLNFSLVDPDGDGDGLPDYWEMLYFSNTQVAVASEDDDRDGAANDAEYRAGTHPRNPSSRFELKATQAGNEMVLSWESGINRHYSLLTATNLIVRTETQLKSLAATPPTNIATVSLTEARQAYFWVRVE
jgi:endoglucanase